MRWQAAAEAHEAAIQLEEAELKVAVTERACRAQVLPRAEHTHTHNSHIHSSTHPLTQLTQ